MGDHLSDQRKEQRENHPNDLVDFSRTGDQERDSWSSLFIIGVGIILLSVIFFMFVKNF